MILRMDLELQLMMVRIEGKVFGIYTSLLLQENNQLGLQDLAEAQRNENS
ncbi:unnamed protein product [Paramecium sonneborni]|uniref:Uncharacterized protein n=1 Tax=Paramecium sonneborni TaxID=65129 RepID=A0A8S1QQ21_9CILI|nr:unnamed protein product [Paramecium sonneborni]